uniref:Transposase n=1 Tax=Heterorhabditis bacteriophora TaxID=37862 RepID=A0A1I7XLS7_HETBA
MTVKKEKFYGLRRIARSASLESVGLVVLMPQKLGVEDAGQVSQYCPITNDKVSTTYTRT